MTEQVFLPAEIEQMAQNVSIEKRNEVQSVLNHVFNGVTKMREQLDLVVVTDENDKTAMKMANTIRLGVRQVRLDAEKEFDQKRSEVQQQMLSFKTEDSLWLKAKQVMQILTKEIEETAKWKEATKERIEAERKELKVHERIMKVLTFSSEVFSVKFENMSDSMFDLFLSGLEKQYNDKIEAEKKAEIQRLQAIEDTKERERLIAIEAEKIRLENANLKAEAERKELELKAEREKAEKELKLQKELAEKEAKRLSDIVEKERIESEAKQKAIEETARIEREKAEVKQAQLEAEIKAKNEAELKAKQESDRKEKERIEAEKQAAKAPDKDRLNAWVASMVINPVGVGNMSKESIDVANSIFNKFSAFKTWAKSEIKKL